MIVWELARAQLGRLAGGRPSDVISVIQNSSSLNGPIFIIIHTHTRTYKHTYTHVHIQMYNNMNKYRLGRTCTQAVLLHWRSFISKDCRHIIGWQKMNHYQGSAMPQARDGFLKVHIWKSQTHSNNWTLTHPLLLHKPHCFQLHDIPYYTTTTSYTACIQHLNVILTCPLRWMKWRWYLGSTRTSASTMFSCKQNSS